MGVDTNRRIIKGELVWVTGVSEFRKIFTIDRSGMIEPAWRFDFPICFAFTGPRDESERAGWALTSDFIHTSQKYDRCPRVALVVDAYLDQLREYNARTRPFVATAVLPKRLTLVYAAFDSGGEYLVNHILREADRISRLCLQKIASGVISLSRKRIPDLPFESLLKILPTAQPSSACN